MAYTNYIHRTPSSNGNRQKFTISTWVKRPEPVGQGWILTVDSYSSGNMAQFQLDTGSYLGFQQYHGSSIQASVITNNFLRDVNAWYHLVLRVDTTQSTAADRVRIYINGTEASYNSPSYPSQNFEYQINHTTKHSIGSREDTSDGSSVYYSHYHLCDGYSYAPTEFGETDSTTGEWKIKANPSVSYGTNGFFIFKDGMNLSGSTVQDQSGQSHNLTLVGTSVETQDNPSNVFATFNELARLNNFDQRYVTHTEGNNTATGSSSTNNGNTYSTLGASSGKFYCEFKTTDVRGTGYPNIGFMSEAGVNRTNGSSGQISTQGGTAYLPNGRLFVDGSETASWGASFTDNDIIQLAMDLDNGALYFGKNGTWQNSGNPASGASKTGAARSFTPDGTFQFFGVAVYESGCQVKANFGNGYFGTTAVSSAGTNASGIGIFEYDVPTGYTALSTKGLNL